MKLSIVQFVPFVCALPAFLPAGAVAQSNAPIAVPSTNMSLSLSTASMYQVISPNASSPLGVQRAALTIQNNNTTGNCWVEDSGLVPSGATTGTVVTLTQPSSHTTTAGAASILLNPGGSYQRYSPLIPNGTIVGACDTAGNSLFVEQQ